MAVMNDCTRDPRVIKEANSLTKNGWRVKIIAHLSPETMNRRRENMNGIDIVRVGPPISFSQKMSLLQGARLFSPILSFGNAIQKNMYLEATKGSFAVYHSHDLDTLRPIFKAARKNNSKCIYDSHELYLEVLKENIASEQRLIHRIIRLVLFMYYSLVERILIKRVDHIITVSDGIANRFATTYSIKKPMVIKNCPPYHRLNKKGSVNISLPYRRFLILYCGWFQKERNIPAIVESIKFLPTRYHLVLLGDGPEKEKVVRAIEDNLLGGRITVTKVDPDKLASIISQAKVGLVPLQQLSLNEKYALPNKLFEYMMAGVPVVASDMPEVAKIVNEEKIGATFTSFEPREIARSIRKVVESPNYDQMRRNALRAAREKYNWEREESKLLALYESMLDK